MNTGGRSRSELIEEVWPDKVLYAATLLLITAILGILHGLAFSLFDITLSQDIPALLRVVPPSVVLGLSLVEAAGAIVALRNQQTRWTLVAGVAGVLSLSLFGLGSVLALVALVFVGLARMEGEDASSEAMALAPETWPDKALAASTVLVVAGVLTLGWGVANVGEFLVFEGYMPQAAFGWICIALGFLALVAGRSLYRQQGALLGVLASLGVVLGLALYLVGPLLGVIALSLIRAAHRENEFEPEQAASPSTVEA